MHSGYAWRSLASFSQIKNKYTAVYISKGHSCAGEFRELRTADIEYSLGYKL